MKQKFLTLTQASHLTGLSADTLRRWAKEGLIPVTKVKRRMILRQEDLEQLLTKNQTGLQE